MKNLVTKNAKIQLDMLTIELAMPETKSQFSELQIRYHTLNIYNNIIFKFKKNDEVHV